MEIPEALARRKIHIQGEAGSRGSRISLPFSNGSSLDGWLQIHPPAPVLSYNDVVPAIGMDAQGRGHRHREVIAMATYGA